MNRRTDQTSPPEAPAHDRDSWERTLVLGIGKRSYSLQLSDIAGIVDCGHVHPVPGAPAPVLGLIEWQGNLVTVLDLPRLLRIQAPEGSACLVRLAPPLLHIALRVPGQLKLACETSLPTIDPVDLVRDVLAVEDREP